MINFPYIEYIQYTIHIPEDDVYDISSTRYDFTDEYNGSFEEILNECSIFICNSLVTFFIRNKYITTENDAKAFLQPFIESWEMKENCKRGLDQWKLTFSKSKFIYPLSTNDNNCIVFLSGMMIEAKSTLTARISVDHNKYPELPYNFHTSDIMIAIYNLYKTYNENYWTLNDHRIFFIISLSYFALTLIEERYGCDGRGSQKRKFAAKSLNIDINVLNKIGTLTGIYGGVNARKALGFKKPLTEQDRIFLETWIKQILIRIGEKDGGKPNLPFLS